MTYDEQHREIDRLRKALITLKDWPLRSICFDGTRATCAAESLANARRFAGDAAEGEGG